MSRIITNPREKKALLRSRHALAESWTISQNPIIRSKMEINDVISSQLKRLERLGEKSDKRLPLEESIENLKALADFLQKTADAISECHASANNVFNSMTGKS